VQQSMPLESSIILLSQGLWPSYKYTIYNVPQSISTRIQEYTEYYMSYEKLKRHLSWPLSLSTCVVSVNFKQGKKELDVNFLEAIILDQFNNFNTITVSDISNALNIFNPDDLADLNAAILTLSCGNFKILIKEPAVTSAYIFCKGLKITPSDEVTFNDDFHNEMFRIKITRFSVTPEVSTDSKASPIDYLEQQTRIQSIIVFHIKKRKRLTIREITDLVIGSKKCIATVIIIFS
ncbi:hypothetical protein MXB_3654, partial [Myxobolus squamalis]